MLDTAYVSPTPEEVQRHFRSFEVALTKHPWDESKHGRKPKADEFMLMHVRRLSHRTEVGFKHHDTRNYIFLFYSFGDPMRTEILVPRTPEPFMRGKF
jgi:hypothetical protein